MPWNKWPLSNKHHVQKLFLLSVPGATGSVIQRSTLHSMLAWDDVCAVHTAHVFWYYIGIVFQSPGASCRLQMFHSASSTYTIPHTIMMVLCPPWQQYILKSPNTIIQVQSRWSLCRTSCTFCTMTTVRLSATQEHSLHWLCTGGLVISAPTNHHIDNALLLKFKIVVAQRTGVRCSCHCVCVWVCCVVKWSDKKTNYIKTKPYYYIREWILPFHITFRNAMLRIECEWVCSGLQARGNTEKMARVGEEQHRSLQTAGQRTWYKWVHATLVSNNRAEMSYQGVCVWARNVA